MPLHDHPNLPARSRINWRSIHTVWAAQITHYLNSNRLPQCYRAEPVIKFHHGNDADEHAAAMMWTPARPLLVAQVEFGDFEICEVPIYDSEASRSLVAAIELVSPGTKERPAHRDAFAITRAAYLQQSVSLVVVDPITEHRSNMHEVIMRRIHLGDDVVQAVTAPLYAVAYRTAGIGTRMRLEVWPAKLAVGSPLPTLPLWIAPTIAVPLDRETTYNAACASLRIRP
jgi:hypothetical protein